MAFIPSMVKSPKNPPSKQDVNNAVSLHSAISKSGRRRYAAWSQKAWSNEFRILRSQLRGSPQRQAADRIAKCLNWYVKNIGKEYVPQILSAKSFRTKFEQIEAAIHRDERDNPNVEITEQAEVLAHRIKVMNSWSLKCKAELPLVVQISLTNAGIFVEKLQRFRKRLNKQPYSKRVLMEGFTDKVMASFSGGVESFVTHWMNKVNDRILNWEGWSGKLLSWAFSESHKNFEIMGMSMAYQYGRPELWNQLKESLKCQT